MAQHDDGTRHAQAHGTHAWLLGLVREGECRARAIRGLQQLRGQTPDVHLLDGAVALAETAAVHLAAAVEQLELDAARTSARLADVYAWTTPVGYTLDLTPPRLHELDDLAADLFKSSDPMAQLAGAAVHRLVVVARDLADLRTVA